MNLYDYVCQQPYNIEKIKFRSALRLNTMPVENECVSALNGNVVGSPSTPARRLTEYILMESVFYQGSLTEEQLIPEKCVNEVSFSKV